ncbi:glutamine synthetase family protein [Capillimicrobium parvum]|uniref:Glutamate--methylamine ligase n=1 Tax=Capillimicrobium parvum TaxID=2884022 RepID=A0A9E7C391_9ACTN|nr:glutamine synthetase family protein [Capillimicrobium parvum]UGS38504.1 Glutamate--methylamine ligase [Capillimicrobium parvum]
MIPDAAKVVRLAGEAGLRLVRFLYCGNDGTVRGKASSLNGLEGRMASGIGVTVGMQAMNSLDQLQPVAGMGPVGELRLVPDPATFRVLPYAPNAGAMLTDHVGLDGAPAPVCARSFLKRQVARLAERGAVLHAGFENEFTLAVERDGALRPVDESLCFSTIGMAASQDYVDALAHALERQQIRLEQYYAELGHGQQEISTAPAPALPAADEQLLVRETLRGVATQMGYVASLSPKPWPDAAGNGGHIHFSLWSTDGARNLFHDAAQPDRLSQDARRFIAGVLAHLPGLCGLAAPSFASYKRIVPHFWAGAFACWGLDNREAPVRVPSVFGGQEEASTNVELKAADATCNPYLALGGLIAAGLDGLERRLDPPEPVAVDPATLDEAQRRAQGIDPLPATQEQALDALAGDPVLAGALGPVIIDSYLAVRRSEWHAYSERDDDFWQRGHFVKY